MVKTLTQDRKLNELARRHVILALREILSDPDAGLTLRPEAARRLKQSLRSKQKGDVRDLRETLKKYGR